MISNAKPVFSSLWSDCPGVKGRDFRMQEEIILQVIGYAREMKKG